MEKVYEEVDEDQYSRMVRDRQDNDWIVDDGESEIRTCIYRVVQDKITIQHIQLHISVKVII